MDATASVLVGILDADNSVRVNKSCGMGAHRFAKQEKTQAYLQ